MLLVKTNKLLVSLNRTGYVDWLVATIHSIVAHTEQVVMMIYVKSVVSWYISLKNIYFSLLDEAEKLPKNENLTTDECGKLKKKIISSMSGGSTSFIYQQSSMYVVKTLHRILILKFQKLFLTCVTRYYDYTQWSNYTIIYEGGRKIWRAIASLEKIFSRPPQKSHFGKQKACKATNE